MSRLVVASLVALLGTPSSAMACSCAPASRDQVISSTPVVFEGRVLRVDTRGAVQVTTLKVVRPIKGVSSGATVKARSRTSSAACGYDFGRAGGTLFVGGTGAGRGAISVNLCTMHGLNR
jgi:hypothetical protein